MRESRTRTPDFIPYLLLAAAVAVAYANVYGNAFLADDNVLIVNNRLLRGWHHWHTLLTKTLVPGCPYYRPVQGFLNLFVYQIAGASLIAFHLPNVLLHIANACLIYALGRKLNFAPLPVFLAALIWALHPIETESVTQISGVADVLYTFFCLLGLLVLFPDFSKRRYWLAAPLMLLALMSKEAAVVFPLLALICMLYCLKDKWRDARVWLRIWPLIMTAFIYTLVWLFILYSMLQPSLMQVQNPQLHVFNYAVLATPFYYIKMLLWPTGLHFGHDLPLYANLRHADVAAGIALLVVGLVQIFRPQSVRSGPLTWGVLWFIAAQLPTSFFVSDNKIYEHWMYLPFAGLLLGGLQALYLCVAENTGKKIFIGAAILLAPLLGGLTFMQNKIWKTPEVFYQTAIREEKGPALNAHFNLGAAYAQNNQYGKALEQFAYAIDHSNEGAISRGMLASIQIEWGATILLMPKSETNTNEAEKHFVSALSIDPDNALALDALSHLYMDKGDAVEATAYREKAKAARAKSVTMFDPEAIPEEKKE